MDSSLIPSRLSAWTTRVIDRMVPEGHSVEENRRLRVTAGAALVALGAGFSTTVINALGGAGQHVVEINLAIFAAFVVCVPLIRHAPARIGPLAGAAYLNVATLVLLNAMAHVRGGLPSVTLGWFPVVVVLTRLTLPRRPAALFCAAWVASI